MRLPQADVIPQGMYLYMVLNPSSAKSLNAPVGTVFVWDKTNVPKSGVQSTRFANTVLLKLLVINCPINPCSGGIKSV